MNEVQASIDAPVQSSSSLPPASHAGAGRVDAATDGGRRQTTDSYDNQSCHLTASAIAARQRRQDRYARRPRTATAGPSHCRRARSRSCILRRFIASFAVDVNSPLAAAHSAAPCAGRRSSPIFLSASRNSRIRCSRSARVIWSRWVGFCAIHFAESALVRLSTRMTNTPASVLIGALTAPTARPGPERRADRLAEHAEFRHLRRARERTDLHHREPLRLRRRLERAGRRRRGKRLGLGQQRVDRLLVRDDVPQVALHRANGRTPPGLSESRRTR